MSKKKPAADHAANEAADCINLVFSQYDKSKAIKFETVNGVVKATFEAFLKGKWRKVWVSVGSPVIVGGMGEISGGLSAGLFSIAREEAYALGKIPK